MLDDVGRCRRVLSMPSRAVPTETCSLDQTIDDMSTVEVGRQEISADFAATDMLGELATVVQHPGLMNISYWD